MKNEQIFNTELEKAVEIRTIIQDVYRKKYERLKQYVKETLGLEKKHFKHLVDMYHYRFGGYPNETSPPKHAELIQNFCLMVRYFGVMGLTKLVTDEMEKYGVVARITQVATDLNQDEAANFNQAFCLQEVKGIRDKDLRAELETKLKSAATFAQALRCCLAIADNYQGSICQHSNEIKHDIAPIIEAQTEIKKSDFNNTVMFNYRLNSRRIKEKHLDKIKASVKSKVVSSGVQIGKAKTVNKSVSK